MLKKSHRVCFLQLKDESSKFNEEKEDCMLRLLRSVLRMDHLSVQL